MPSQLLRSLEEDVTRKDLKVLANPLPTDDALLIHEEEGPLRNQIRKRWVFYLPDGAVEHAITPGHLQTQIAEQGVRQVERVGEGFLGKGIVGTDSEHLDVQVLELAVVSLPGRQVRRSRGSEISAIELDEHELLPLELSQT